MPEYLGYKSDKSKPIDWNNLAGDIGETINTPIGTRSKEREYFDEIQQKNAEIINNYELGQNPTMNNIVLNGVDVGRELGMTWNKMANEGQMTRSEYTKRQNTLSNSFSSLANTAKSFDERATKVLARQQSVEGKKPAGSGYEAYMNSSWSEIADLKNKSLYISEKGTMYLASYNENGEIIDKKDVRQMNNPQNMLDNRVDLNTAVTSGTKGWKEWEQRIEESRGKTTTTTDVRNNEMAFTTAKEDLISSILTNSRAITSVLVDNSDGKYYFYSTPEEKKANIEKAKEKAIRVAELSNVKFDEKKFNEEIESLMIESRLDDGTGVTQPYPTDEQTKRARDIVSNTIEISIGHKESGTSARAYSGGVYRNNTTAKEVERTLADEMSDIWRDPKNVQAFDVLSGGDYMFRWADGGMQVMESGVILTDDQNPDLNYTPGGRLILDTQVKDIEDIAKYFYGNNAKSIMKFKADLKAGQARRKKNTKPKAY